MSGPDPLVRPPAAPRWRGELRIAAPALLGYAAVRLLGVAVLAWWASDRGVGLWDLLGRRWDSIWYVGIAEHGYDAAIPPAGPSGNGLSNLAFFPLYPELIRVLSGVTRLDMVTVGIAVSWLFALAAAWGIFAVGMKLHDRRTGVLLAVLWGVLPHALAESMAYTEPVFTAFAAWSLCAVISRRWLSAGLLSLLAGLTRPTGIAVAAAVSLAAVVALWGSRRSPGTSGSEPAAPWRCLVGAVVAPLGWLGYVAWVGLRLHRWDGYFLVQQKWGSTFDGGAFTVQYIADMVSGSRATTLVTAVISMTLVVSVVLLLLCLFDRIPLALVVYAAALLVITLGGFGYFHAKARFLIPAFPLLLPVACALARAGRGRAVVIVGACALASAVYGGHLALVWSHSP